jgi:hypothetical protein
VKAALWQAETGVVWFGIGSPHFSRPSDEAHSPHAISFLQPALGSQLKAGASPPQAHRLVRARGVARARGARRMLRKNAFIFFDCMFVVLVACLGDVENCWYSKFVP